MRLFDDLGTPDDFAGNPYGYLTNQISHAAIGAAFVWLWPPLALGLMVAAIGVEVWHITKGGTVLDSVEDLAFIGAGALMPLTGWHWLLIPVAAVLALGAWARAR